MCLNTHLGMLCLPGMGSLVLPMLSPLGNPGTHPGNSSRTCPSSVALRVLGLPMVRGGGHE